MKKLQPIHYVQLITFAVVYIGIMLLVRKYIVDAPTLINNLKSLYDTYGYALIFGGAILEGMFLIGLYVPGSLVVLLGAALSRTGVLLFPLVILLAVLGLNIGYALNYLLGKYGWYRLIEGFGFKKQIDQAKAKLVSSETFAMFLGYVTPSAASFLSTAAGMLRLPFKRFIVTSLITQTFWSLVWGTLAYSFGLKFVEYFIQYFGFVVVIILAVYLYRKLPEKEEKLQEKN